MIDFLRHRAIWAAFGLLLAYILLALVTPPEHLKRIMDAGRFGFALAVAIICTRPTLDVFRNGVQQRSDQVVVAVWLIWVVTTFAAVWIPANRELTFPGWVPTAQISAAIPYLYMVSAAFFLIPIGNGREDLPAGNWPLIFMAGVIGGAAVGLMFGLGIGSLIG